MRCCICHESFEGMGNNPRGALDCYGKEIKWKKSDRCCDRCNFEQVVPGRVVLLYRKRRG